jgi:hypothetical protein
VNRTQAGARPGGHLENRNQEQLIVYFCILGYRGGKVQYVLATNWAHFAAPCEHSAPLEKKRQFLAKPTDV